MLNNNGIEKEKPQTEITKTNLTKLFQTNLKAMFEHSHRRMKIITNRSEHNNPTSNMYLWTAKANGRDILQKTEQHPWRKIYNLTKWWRQNCKVRACISNAHVTPVSHWLRTVLRQLIITKCIPTYDLICTIIVQLHFRKWLWVIYLRYSFLFKYTLFLYFASMASYYECVSTSIHYHILVLIPLRWVGPLKLSSHYFSFTRNISRKLLHCNLTI